MTAGRLLFAIVGFGVLLVLGAAMAGRTPGGLADGSAMGAGDALQGATGACIDAWNAAPPDRPAPGSTIYLSGAPTGDYCNVAFEEPDGSVGAWSYSPIEGWARIGTGNRSKTEFLGTLGARVDGRTVDADGRIVAG